MSTSTCLQCEGTGFYYTEVCKPPVHNHNNRTERGIKTCSCPAGIAKDAAIRDHAKKPPPARRRAKDEEWG